MDDHKLPIEELCIKYNTDQMRGLTDEAVERYHLEYGSNCLSPPKKKNIILQYLKHLGNIFNILLVLSGVLSFVLFATNTSDNSNLYLGFILPAIALINAFMSFYQEYKTAALLESFIKLIPSNSQVIRNGVTSTIPVKDLVPGDLVNLKDGDKIPADIRIIKSTDLKVDNSSLTGESEPQERDAVISTHANQTEASNLAFNGTTVVRGTGQGIVVKIGDDTFLGQIANITMKETKREAQMVREINLFVKKLGVVAILSAIILVIAGFIRGYTITINVSVFIGVFVSWVPEGLPIAVTSSLAIAAKRMAQLNVIVKDLHAVETLGSITLLATDKTGTLTQNRMTAVGIWIQLEHCGIGDKSNQIEYHGAPITITLLPNLETLVYICALCTKCYIDESERDKPINERRIIGEPTEVGLYRFAMTHCDVVQISQCHSKVCEIPFSSSTKWHLTVHEFDHENGSYAVFIKGAPERVIAKCSNILDAEGWVSITDEHITAFNAAYENFARQGQRVLAFARILLPERDFPKGFKFEKKEAQNFPIEGFTFVALISLMDPPKHGVRKAIAALRTAGIQTVMVTGDHPLTAEAIARKIGLIEGDTIMEAALRLQKPVSMVQDDEYDAIVVHGDRIDGMTDEDWDRVLSKRYVVFARTSPLHKLMIVTRAQAKGHIVGVSGDGVNDSPALKKADLGISMNLTGSDVSKEAATMILMDDNFPTIINGISQGRLLFANLKKTIRYTLTHIFPEVAAFIGYVLFAIPLPFPSLLILAMDAVSELFPGVSYSYEQPEDELMFLPPRKVLCTEEKNYATYRLETHPTSSFSVADIGQVRSPTVASTTLKNNYWWKRWWNSFKTFIKKHYQLNETGEVLVDNELLLWSYLQGGMFVTIGAYGAYLMQFFVRDVPLTYLWDGSQTYFIQDAPPIILSTGQSADANEQLTILASAQAAYFAGCIIGQMFTLFLVKKRYSYPWGLDLFANKVALWSLLFSASIAACVIYIPAFNEFFPSGPVGILALLMPVGSGILYYGYECMRKYLIIHGHIKGMPKKNVNLLELVRTTTTIIMPPQNIS